MLIGIDIGTSNIKAVAFADDGAVLASAERPNRVLSPQPGWSEQEPEAVFQCVMQVMQEVIGRVGDSGLRGIVFSSAMHGLAVMDKKGRPLNNFMLWSDLRADAIAQELRQSETGRAIYTRTGVPIHAMSPLCKLIWLRRHAPQIFNNAHKYLGIKEYVWYRLTGKYQSDISVASATGLMDLRRNDWDPEALALAGISPEQLPELVSPYKSGSTSSAPLPCPLLIGASDGALANLGSGATGPGQVAVTIGTSAAIRTVVPEPVIDALMRVFCYRIDERRCILGGASNNGANAMEWLRNEVFRSGLDAGAFAAQASQVGPACDGLLFLPYILGERAPLYRADATGSFQGLRMAHSQPHFVRALMEGVVFNLKIIAEVLDARQPVHTLYAGGGFSKSHLWVQILADIFQKPVVLHDKDADASVMGAILMAREALKLSPLPATKTGVLIEPDTRNAQVYEEAFQKFRLLASQPSRSG